MGNLMTAMKFDKEEIMEQLREGNTSALSRLASIVNTSIRHRDAKRTRL